MKIIQPSVEIFGNPHENQIQHIEKVARLCYKSESAITEGSASRMVVTLIRNKHLAMIEHGVFVLEVNDVVYGEIESFEHPYINISETYVTYDPFSPRYIVSGSARGFIERFAENPMSYIPIIRYLANDFPELFMPTITASVNAEAFKEYDVWIRDCGFEDKVRLMSCQEISELTNEEKLLHRHTSVKFVTDRGVSHEIVRHRPASYAQESSRYVNYSNGKHGSEITVIEPFFFEKGTKDYIAWEYMMSCAENTYMQMIERGRTPQEARSVLPNSLKTEIVMTANDAEWLHFFELRDDSHAHPSMVQVSHPLHQMFRDNYPDNFK